MENDDIESKEEQPDWKKNQRLRSKHVRRYSRATLPVKVAFQTQDGKRYWMDENGTIRRL